MKKNLTVKSNFLIAQKTSGAVKTLPERVSEVTAPFFIWQ